MRRTPAFTTIADPLPMKDLNTTPLIDVLLVLLVMFIITIPAQMHKTPVDLPSGGAAADRPIARLDIGAGGALLWNGAPIAEASLPARFRALVADPKQPVLHIAADGAARYEVFAETLAQAKRAGITRLGMVDNARFVEAIAAR